MEKSALITIPTKSEPKQFPTKKIFSQMFPENSQFKYCQNRYSWQIEKQSQQKILTPSFATFRCQKKPQENDKQNSNTLPQIKGGRKKTRIDRYFSRNDIVKERCEQSSEKGIHFFDETASIQSKRVNKYKKFSPTIQNISRVKKAWTGHHKSTDMIASKSLVYDKQEESNRLQTEMKEWALIKKKNEYEAFKLMRKNNYQRMRSNMIITQAMSELMDKREELLRREESSKEIYYPLNQHDIASIRFSDNL